MSRYCVSCHNDRLRPGGISLEQLEGAALSGHEEVWEKVIRKVRAGQMPPAGSRRPPQAELDAFVATLEGRLDQLAAAQPNPGRPLLHRLNRAEYENAVRDVLALQIDGRAFFPADDSGYGFDNIADVLSISPMLVERYMTAAQKVSRLAVGDPLAPPVVESYYVGKYIRQDERRGEDLPFGSRGGLAVTHYFPVDGEYLLKIYLDRTYTGQVRGMAEKHQLEVRVNGEQIKQFDVGGVELDEDGNPVPPRVVNRGQDAAAPAPGAATPGAGRGRGAPTPEQSAAAEKRVAERAARIVAQGQIAGQRAEQSQDADAHLFVRFPAKAGPATVAVSFNGKGTIHEGIRRHPLMITSYEYAGNTVGDPAVESIDVTGPFNVQGRGETPSRRRIFVCRPAKAVDEAPCARQVLSAVAQRAYRRAPTRDELATLLSFYEAGRADGDFDAGIQAALERVLVSPQFLFRSVPAPAGVAPGGVFPLTDVQLASRLSFFFWSSVPDDELRRIAAEGKLSQPSVLDRQVRRMLADRRSNALISNFAGQWLMLRNLRLVTPDPYEFPDFDDNLREAFQRETELFLDSQIRDDRGIGDLLTADYTFLNQRLAEHYGIPNVYGSHFRRVALPDDLRQGLLGHGSILTVTSYSNRTSPVFRGKFLLENILGTPPPPPPPDVPQLKENEAGSAVALSVRERLEQHRSNPVCASCHKLMDPLGFALENFDAIGRYRTMDGNTRVDPSGVMPDGTQLTGPPSLRAALSARREQFVHAVAEKLLTYAIGRGIEAVDAPAIRRIVRSAKAEHYSWSALMRGIVTSTPFRMATAESAASGQSVSNRPRAELEAKESR